ncbi:MAG: hypothetical protein U5N55_09140 [Cypionkella sp.]|nr:hypothetical protein [Cypionkella sp.]
MAVKTQGTNCAFRMDALRKIGGFDPAFAFYLDEADVNLAPNRPSGQAAINAARRWRCITAISASAASNPIAPPPSLAPAIAASTAALLSKHAPLADCAARLHRYAHPPNRHA